MISNLSSSLTLVPEDIIQATLMSKRLLHVDTDEPSASAEEPPSMAKRLRTMTRLRFEELSEFFMDAHAGQCTQFYTNKKLYFENLSKLFELAPKQVGEILTKSVKWMSSDIDQSVDVLSKSHRIIGFGIKNKPWQPELVDEISFRLGEYCKSLDEKGLIALFDSMPELFHATKSLKYFLPFLEKLNSEQIFKYLIRKCASGNSVMHYPTNIRLVMTLSHKFNPDQLLNLFNEDNKLGNSVISNQLCVMYLLPCLREHIEKIPNAQDRIEIQNDIIDILEMKSYTHEQFIIESNLFFSESAIELFEKHSREDFLFVLSDPFAIRIFKHMTAAHAKFLMGIRCQDGRPLFSGRVIEKLKNAFRSLFCDDRNFGEEWNSFWDLILANRVVEFLTMRNEGPQPTLLIRTMNQLDARMNIINKMTQEQLFQWVSIAKEDLIIYLFEHEPRAEKFFNFLLPSMSTLQKSFCNSIRDSEGNTFKSLVLFYNIYTTSDEWLFTEKFLEKYVKTAVTTKKHIISNQAEYIRNFMEIKSLMYKFNQFNKPTLNGIFASFFFQLYEKKKHELEMPHSNLDRIEKKYSQLKHKYESTFLTLILHLRLQDNWAGIPNPLLVRERFEAYASLLSDFRYFIDALTELNKKLLGDRAGIPGAPMLADRVHDWMAELSNAFGKCATAYRAEFGRTEEEILTEFNEDSEASSLEQFIGKMARDVVEEVINARVHAGIEHPRGEPGVLFRDDAHDTLQLKASAGLIRDPMDRLSYITDEEAKSILKRSWKSYVIRTQFLSRLKNDNLSEHTKRQMIEWVDQFDIKYLPSYRGFDPELQEAEKKDALFLKALYDDLSKIESIQNTKALADYIASPEGVSLNLSESWEVFVHGLSDKCRNAIAAMSKEEIAVVKSSLDHEILKNVFIKSVESSVSGLSIYPILIGKKIAQIEIQSHLKDRLDLQRDIYKISQRNAQYEKLRIFAGEECDLQEVVECKKSFDQIMNQYNCERKLVVVYPAFSKYCGLPSIMLKTMRKAVFKADCFNPNGNASLILVTTLLSSIGVLRRR